MSIASVSSAWWLALKRRQAVSRSRFVAGTAACPFSNLPRSFMTFRHGPRPAERLAIVGDPARKLVAEMIHRNPGGQVLAYHVCRADDPETLRPATFVMSLAGMIAGRLPAFADLLEAPQFRELFDPSSVSSRPGHVFDQGLIAGLHQLPAPSGGVGYLLIDALDEALTLRAGEVNLVTLLSPRVERFPPWLHIVATTRREPDVLNRLSGLRAASIDAHRQDNLDDSPYSPLPETQPWCRKRP